MSQNIPSEQRPMRIAILLNDFSGTGVPRVTLQLAEGLEKRGCDVEILVLDPTGPMRDQVGSSLRVVPLGASRALWAFPKLSRYLRAQRLDALIAAEDQLGIIAAAACLASRSAARLLVTQHVPYSPVQKTKHWKGRFFVRVLRLFWRRINVFSTVSAGMADDISKATGIPRNEFHVLYNAAILESKIGREPDPKIHPFFESGSKVILGIGSLHRRKGFRDLIEAVRLVSETEDVRLIILGEGRERAALQAQIDAAGLGDRCDLPGYADDPYRFLSTADLFVLPSYFEGLPTVLIEALASGCPCVATDCVSGPREILKEGALGPLVEVGDCPGLADAIRHVLRSPQPAEALFERARRFTERQIAVEALELLGFPVPTVP